jgi:hypothetical protein
LAHSGKGLYRLVVSFAGTDAVRFGYCPNKDFAVPDFAGPRGPDDRLDGLKGIVIRGMVEQNTAERDCQARSAEHRCPPQSI